MLAACSASHALSTACTVERPRHARGFLPPIHGVAPVRIRVARPEDASEIAQVHVEGWRTAFRGIMPAAFLDGLAVEPRRAFWQEIIASPPPHTRIHVAEEPRGGVVGFALGGPERTGDPLYRGELQAIYLLEPYHRRGIGRSLTEAVAHDCVQHGYGAMLVWVLRENPWHRFYEALGGRLLREREIEISGTRYPERAYGWPDVAALIGRRVPPAAG
jgi:GNAT superfamily N-acetyltransferase